VTVAANLKEAAQDAFGNLNTLWLATTLKAKLALFCDAALPIFPQERDNNHPVSNWTTLLDALQDAMPASPTFLDLNAAVDQLYRLCWIGYYLQGQSLITSAQATALLAAYNLQFG
jgi:hypothetical protein